MGAPKMRCARLRARVVVLRIHARRLARRARTKAARTGRVPSSRIARSPGMRRASITLNSESPWRAAARPVPGRTHLLRSARRAPVRATSSATTMSAAVHAVPAPPTAALRSRRASGPAVCGPTSPRNARPSHRPSAIRAHQTNRNRTAITRNATVSRSVAHSPAIRRGTIGTPTPRAPPPRAGRSFRPGKRYDPSPDVRTWLSRRPDSVCCEP
jgi:hypothetical protein